MYHISKCITSLNGHSEMSTDNAFVDVLRFLGVLQQFNVMTCKGTSKVSLFLQFAIAGLVRV